MRKLVRNLSAIILMLLGMNSVAAPVVWELNDVLMADGATVSGSFVFDESGSGSYTNIDITITGGSFLPANNYSNEVFSAGGFSLQLVGDDGSLLKLVFENPLNAPWLPEPWEVNLAVRGWCPSYDCLTDASYQSLGDPLVSENVNMITGGSAHASVVPLPAAAWLFGSALIGMGWFRRIRNITHIQNQNAQ